jgi:hypothetical protein
VLLLGHRSGLAVQEGAWEVRLAVPDDVVGLHGLIGSLANAVEVQEAFLHALGKQGSLTARACPVGNALLASAAVGPLLQAASMWAYASQPDGSCFVLHTASGRYLSFAAAFNAMVAGLMRFKQFGS